MFTATDLAGEVAEKWKLDDPSIDWDAFRSLTLRKAADKKDAGKETLSKDHPLSGLIAKDGTRLSGLDLQNIEVKVAVGRFHVRAPGEKLTEVRVAGGDSGTVALTLRTPWGETLQGVSEEEEFSGHLSGGGSFRVGWKDLSLVNFGPKAPSKQPELQGLVAHAQASGSSGLPETRFKGEQLTFTRKELTLALDSLIVRQIKRLGADAGWEIEIASRGDIRLSSMKPTDDQLCLEARIGTACAAWADLTSVEFRPKPVKGASPEPPRRTAYLVRTVSGDEISTTSLEGEYSSATVSGEKPVVLHVGSFRLEIRPETIAGWARQGELATVALSDGTSLTGVPSTSQVSGGLLLGGIASKSSFRLPARDIASIQVRRKLPPMKPRQAALGIRIVEKSGSEMLVDSLRAYEERHICGNCICLGGGCAGFPDQEPTKIPLDQKGSVIEVIWSDLKRVEMLRENTLSLTKKNGSVLSGTLKFDATRYCECSGETGFLGRTRWGAAFLKLEDLRSIELP
ncbi:MAG: hypothetical protein HYY65_10530 [Candidatus Tectomicrobia bacterium]|uniref:Uncharacterized protein n=1 Tax=Tectimicrobiota bacterium TaxID=2528274 RepID=A0A932M1H2_UNCTE|nr:hypothetical protein [Candidatus Tectomicrobia bacterium]